MRRTIILAGILLVVFSWLATTALISYVQDAVELPAPRPPINVYSPIRDVPCAIDVESLSLSPVEFPDKFLIAGPEHEFSIVRQSPADIPLPYYKVWQGSQFGYVATSTFERDFRLVRVGER